jgi:hypothetical protein
MASALNGVRQGCYPNRYLRSSENGALDGDATKNFGQKPISGHEMIVGS